MSWEHTNTEWTIDELMSAILKEMAKGISVWILHNKIHKILHPIEIQLHFILQKGEQPTQSKSTVCVVHLL